MPILSYTDTKTFRGRLVVFLIYASLLAGGVTMVYPFLVTVTGSLGNPFDYERRSPLPRFLWSREDRFMRTLCTYFPPGHRQTIRQLRAYFPDLPADWQIWAQIGDDPEGTDAWARQQLEKLEDPITRQHFERMAADYGEFMQTWNVRETILAYDQRQVAPFLRERYQTLDAFNAAWEFSVDDFYKVNAAEWSGEPIDLPNYVPEPDARYDDLLLFREEYRRNRYNPYLGGPEAPAGYLRPAALRFLWEDFMVAADPKCDPARLPFPVPRSRSRQTSGDSSAAPPDGGTTNPDLLAHWHRFLKDVFPLRHVAISVTEARRRAFREFLRERFRNLSYLNEVLDQSVQDWSDLPLTATVPAAPPLAKVWMDFLRTRIPPSEWEIRDTLPELAFQQFVLARYGSLEGVNRAYGLNLSSLQQLRIPFGEALLITFANREWAFTWDQATANFRSVIDFLFHRGRAVQNTIVLVVLSLLVTLTVNPLAGYALSRFQLRASEKILIFCLATMAFPAAVSAIPGFLLLRDLHLLNTFAALVLPGAANGMSIFLLKGFFDSLPRELFEAAAIDGAPERTIFYHVALPLVKPILAVSLLNAFLQAYNAWEWALIVCQDRRMWTIAVWTYQFSQTASGQQPFTVMAAFVLTSIPVLLVFLFCQKIILRGIILPQMK